MMQMLGLARKERGASDSPGPPNPNPNSLPSASSSTSSDTVENSDLSGLEDPAKPLLLVYCDDKGRFHMSTEAVRALQLVKGPVGVVSVCGRARQGKSFILNQLLGRSAGFQVASTHRPCTKGLWIWSAPIKRTAIDGTEYNLLLLDSEGIDAYDQTGTYSTQIFSLAILLSSMFIYNQMGGIDEAALDRLSLVTELTKHIRVKASCGNSSSSEIGKFSPVFVWLLRDFYLDLTENNKKITPRDYLELALRPVQGVGRDISAKNEIRESIRALFPDRECFTLVRPLNNESDLQRLDKMPFDSLRPEFRSGLDSLTKFIFQRTKLKQVGATIMTGPVLAGLTQSFLDAINNGAVPTISSSWQSVEESECRKAYDSAADVYMSSFDRTRPHEELELRDAHEDAIRKSLAAYNSCAVGAGVACLNYEKLLHKFCRKAFEDYKRNAFLEADLQCSNAIHNMETKLQAACRVPGAKLENLIQELASMLLEYESSAHGPGKWKKFIPFLQKCLEGSILDLSKKQLERIESENSALELEYRKSEENMLLLKREKEASEKQRDDYWKQYQAAIKDKERLSKDYMDSTISMNGKIRMLEERISRVSKDLSLAKDESANWKAKFELSCSEHKGEEGKFGAQLATLKSRIETAESKLTAAREQAESALAEKSEWKRKYDVVVRETKNALERAAAAQENTDQKSKEREDKLRAQFSTLLEKQDEEIKNLMARMEQSETYAERCNMELEAARLELKEHESGVAAFKREIKTLSEMIASVKSETESRERDLVMLRQERDNIQENYISECAKYNAADQRLKNSDKEAKKSSELAEIAHAEAARALREKSEAQQLAEQRLAIIERTASQVDTLERERSRLLDEVDKLRMAESDALSKVSGLEERVDNREKEIELMLAENNEHRSDTVQVLEGLLATERAARAEAETRAEVLSLQLQAIQGKLDSVQQELTLVRLNESALDGKRKTTHGKRSRAEDHVGTESVHDMDVDQEVLKDKRRSKSMRLKIAAATSSGNQVEDGDSAFTMVNKDSNPTQEENDTDSGDHTKFTIAKLKQELTRRGFGAELLQLNNPNKRDFLSLYEKLVLQKK